MERILSIVLGLVFAWIILFFIGKKPIVSYYVQAPVQPVEISDLEKIMMAVGLAPSTPEKSVADMMIMTAPVPAPAPAPASVADMAAPSPMDSTNEIMPSPQYSVPVDPGMQTTPQPAAPSPGPAPLDE